MDRRGHDAFPREGRATLGHGAHNLTEGQVPLRVLGFLVLWQRPDLLAHRALPVSGIV